jgi:predicted house-cleaning noncanonical NTP pyrophosphatase (MazG superfamily)
MLFNEVKNPKAEEIKQYISVNVSSNYNTIKPYIETAEAEYIKKLLGDDQYEELVEYYEDHAAAEERLDDLLSLVQKALINLAYFRGFPILIAKIGDGGAYRNENEKQKGLYKYQEVELKNMFKADGFNGLDAVLEYLETNIDLFPLFSASDNYTVFKGSFINTTAEFEDKYSIGGSRIVFLKLKKFIKQAEEFNIIPLIGREYFDELKEQILDNDIDETNVPVIEFIRAAVASHAIARGVTQIGISITDNGIFYQTATGGQFDYKNENLLKPDEVDALFRNARDTGDHYMALLKDFLHENIEDYATYAASSAYDSTNAAHIRDNSNKKTFWT